MTTLVARLHERAEQTPDAVALRDKRYGLWHEITWRQYLHEVALCAAMLDELGVQPGDGVAILSENRPEWLYLDFAAQSLGALAVGVYQTNPAADVAYVVNDSRSVLLLCEDQEQFDKAVEISAQTPTLRHLVVLEPRGTDATRDPRHMSWDDFRTRGAAALAARGPTWFRDQIAARRAADPVMVIYTSGTTGAPKGALLSSDNALVHTERFARDVGISARDTVLSYLPLCHVAEKIYSVFLPLISGVVVHFGESIETVTTDLREVAPTVFLGVPRIWEKMHSQVLLKMEDSSPFKRAMFRLALRVGGRLGELLAFRALKEHLGLGRCWLPSSGAAAISPDILRWFRQIGVPIIEAYGMTELSGVSHYNPPAHNRLGTVGRPVPGVEHKLSEDGEVLVRGPNVFVGYLGNPDATAAMKSADGWLKTGDLGSIDDAGYLSITGRKKEILITSGGKNLSPEKIENALKTSPYIKEAVALGDGKHFIAALIQIERDTVSDWADREKLVYTSYEDLAGKPDVRALIEREVDRANQLLARVEQVRKFKILPKELHQDDGELTPTQKVKRRAIEASFASLCAELYR